MMLEINEYSPQNYSGSHQSKLLLSTVAKQKTIRIREPCDALQFAIAEFAKIHFKMRFVWLYPYQILVFDLGHLRDKPHLPISHLNGNNSGLWIRGLPWGQNLRNSGQTMLELADQKNAKLPVFCVQIWLLHVNLCHTYCHIFAKLQGLGVPTGLEKHTTVKHHDVLRCWSPLVPQTLAFESTNQYLVGSNLFLNSRAMEFQPGCPCHVHTPRQRSKLFGNGLPGSASKRCVSSKKWFRPMVMPFPDDPCHLRNSANNEKSHTTENSMQRNCSVVGAQTSHDHCILLAIRCHSSSHLGRASRRALFKGCSSDFGLFLAQLL